MIVLRVLGVFVLMVLGGVVGGIVGLVMGDALYPPPDTMGPSGDAFISGVVGLFVGALILPFLVVVIVMAFRTRRRQASVVTEPSESSPPLTPGWW